MSCAVVYRGEVRAAIIGAPTSQVSEELGVLTTNTRTAQGPGDGGVVRGHFLDTLHQGVLQRGSSWKSWLGKKQSEVNFWSKMKCLLAKVNGDNCVNAVDYEIITIAY